MNSTIRALLPLLTLLAVSTHAQSLRGTVTDNKKEPIVSAAVSVTQNGVVKAGTITDFDGNFKIDSLIPGMYDVVVRYLGYQENNIKQILVTEGNTTGVNFTLIEDKGFVVFRCPVYTYTYSLVDKYKTSFGVHKWQIKGANR